MGLRWHWCMVLVFPRNKRSLTLHLVTLSTRWLCLGAFQAVLSDARAPHAHITTCLAKRTATAQTNYAFRNTNLGLTWRRPCCIGAWRKWWYSGGMGENGDTSLHEKMVILVWMEKIVILIWMEKMVILEAGENDDRYWGGGMRKMVILVCMEKMVILGSQERG